MAERGSVAMWLKKYLSGAMGAVTIAIATITALTVSTIAVQSGGSLVIDASGDVTLNGNGIAKASGAESLNLSVLGTGDLVLSSADDLTATITDDISISGDAVDITGVTGARIIGQTGSNYTLADSAGVTVSVNGAGDDIVMSSVDDITISNLSGDDISISAGDAVTVASSSAAGGSLTCDSGGVTIGAASAGDDFAISAADDGQVSAGDQLLLSGVTSARIESDSSANFLQCSSTGVTITAGAAGDDISLVTTGGDDLVITLADDYTATGDVFGTTAVTSITAAVTNGGSVAVTAGGVDITASTSGDDISVTASDDVTVTATAGPLLLLGGSGQLQIDGNGGTFNGPVSAAMVAGGTAYPLPMAVQRLTTPFTPGSTAEAIADTLVIPANAWTTTGETLIVTAWGTAAGNTNNKTLAMRLGTSGNCATGTVLPGVNFSLANDQVWHIQWSLYRSALNTQIGWVQATGNAGSTAGTVFARVDLSAARTETAILNACVTVTNATSASDLTINGISWQWN